MLSFPRVSIVAALVVMAPCTGALAQMDRGGPLETHHHFASIHDTHGMDHLQALYHHAQAHVSPSTPLDRDLATEHARAAGEHIAAVQRHLDAEEAAMSDAQRTAQHGRFEEIRAAHAEAAAQQQQLMTEVARPAPDPRIVSDRAAAEYQAMRRAHDAHMAMGRDIGVHEVVVVPASAPPAPPRGGPPPGSRGHH